MGEVYGKVYQYIGDMKGELKTRTMLKVNSHTLPLNVRAPVKSGFLRIR